MCSTYNHFRAIVLGWSLCLSIPEKPRSCVRPFSGMQECVEQLRSANSSAYSDCVAIQVWVLATSMANLHVFDLYSMVSASAAATIVAMVQIGVHLQPKRCRLLSCTLMALTSTQFISCAGFSMSFVFCIAAVWRWPAFPKQLATGAKRRRREEPSARDAQGDDDDCDQTSDAGDQSLPPLHDSPNPFATDAHWALEKRRAMH